MFKIKICNEARVNSAFICGEIINTVLANVDLCYPLCQFSKTIQKICLKYFDFLIKKIIESYYWENNEEVQLQSLIIDELLTSTRLLLLETFYFMLKNDEKNNYQILNEINETFWHTLILWFFEKK